MRFVIQRLITVLAITNKKK